MKTASMLILTACLALPLTAFVPDAQAANNGKVASTAGQSSKLKVSSRAQAIQLAQRQYQGKVLKAQSSSVNSHPGYKVKMLSKEGLVFYVLIDAQTGRISRN
ncbi:PepSY domain-containing protein [Psychromonas sp.]|uniref:PepSY domain-containing protein n=1 Tax=Psychromonas sp. TaxID=1884585 RepID=UPI003569F8D3